LGLDCIWARWNNLGKFIITNTFNQYANNLVTIKIALMMRS
jgi:hypothetical protein